MFQLGYFDLKFHNNRMKVKNIEFMYVGLEPDPYNEEHCATIFILRS